MTFVWHVDYVERDTFEHDAVIRLPLEVDKSLNYAVATVALAHNLGFVYPVDPYLYQSIHDQVKAIINKFHNIHSINQIELSKRQI